jgi:uncharacterized protein YbjQ (UPF0145 family)
MLRCSNSHSGQFPEPTAPPVRELSLSDVNSEIVKVMVPNRGSSSSGGATLQLTTADGRHLAAKRPSNAKPGEFITYEILTDPKRVAVTTLPQIPHTEIVESKSVVWGSACVEYNPRKQIRNNAEADLLREAIEKMRAETVKVGCNAILGLTFQTTIAATGRRLQKTRVTVTACGTPCIVIPASSLEPSNPEAAAESSEASIQQRRSSDSSNTRRLSGRSIASTISRLSQ